MYQTDLHKWAVGVLYLNLGLAVVGFPTSTRAHPAYQVYVGLAPKEPLLEAHRALFPFFVRWDIWHRVVVPLFAEGDALVKVGAAKNETLRQWINKEYMSTGNFEVLLLKIEKLLLQKLEAEKYVPEGTTAVGFLVE